MAIQKKNTEKTEEMKYTIKVSRVKPKKDRPNCYRFTMTVNGIDINGCDYISYTKKNGEEGSFIALPQYKGSDDNYYNIVYFKITDELQAEIERQLEELI